MAQRYGTDHHEFVVRPDAVEIFPQLVWHYNEPYADASAIPTYYLSQLARRHVTVALNGDAGDENFAGYRRYIPTAPAQRFDRLPRPLRRAVGGVARGAPAPGRSDSVMYRGRRWLRRLSDTPEGRYSRRVMIFEPDLKAEVCDAGVPGGAGGRRRAATAARTPSRSPTRADFVDALLDVDVNYYLSDCLLVKVDIATMAHGLEGRSPMLDHEFMEFAASLPADLKLRGIDHEVHLQEGGPRPAAGRHHRSAEEGLRRAARSLVPQRAAGDERRPAARRHAARQRGYFKPGAVQPHARGALERHRVLAEPAVEPADARIVASHVHRRAAHRRAVRSRPAWR